MSRRKRNTVLGLLAVATLWPALHIGLVAAYDVNPWKFAGWGMYSAPQLPSYVRIVCLTPDDVGAYELSSVQPAIEDDLERFLRMRRHLGRLVAPDGLARALLDHYPAIDGVDVEVVEPFLERRTGVVEERSETYAYRR